MDPTTETAADLDRLREAWRRRRPDRTPVASLIRPSSPAPESLPPGTPARLGTDPGGHRGRGARRAERGSPVPAGRRHGRPRPRRCHGGHGHRRPRGPGRRPAGDRHQPDHPVLCPGPERLRSVLAYPEDTAGGLMDPETLSVRPNVTLDVVTRYLRRQSELPDRMDAVLSPGATTIPGDAVLRAAADGRPAGASRTSWTRRSNRSGPRPARRVAREFRTATSSSRSSTTTGGWSANHRRRRRRRDPEQVDHEICRARAWTRKTTHVRAGVHQPASALAVLMPMVATMGGIAGSQTLTLRSAVSRWEGPQVECRAAAARGTRGGFVNGLVYAIVASAVTVAAFGNWMAAGVIGDADQHR